MKKYLLENKIARYGAVAAVTLVMACAAAGEARAGMNLETDAAVSGIAVALNNYYARTMNPEEALAESVKMVANDAIVLDEDTAQKTTHAVQKLVEEVTPTEEKIVKEGEGGLTWGTVKGTKSLRLREKPDAAARTLTLLSEGEHYIVTGQEGQFLKVQVDDDLEGYVFKDYIDTSISYDEELAKEKESLAAQAEQAKKEAEEAMKMLEDAKKALQTAVETKAETKAAETKTKATEADETPAETIKTETKTEKATEAAAANVESKASDTGNTSETVEALNWDDEDDDGNSDDDSNVEVIEAPDFDEEMSEAETEEELEEVEAPAEVITSSNTSGPGGIADATRNAIVAYAKQFLGNPYVYGGTSLTNGCDCSGFTQAIYSYFGKNIGRSSRDQAEKGTPINPASAEPGDLFFYDSNGTINHVAMYIGNGQVIHSSSTATGIKISNAYYRTPCKVCTYF